eukprot:gb/GFBE01063855.1/.p1 GENE.gb/GFBE01063855.1/~~gb/GFBE01063855.1/.p1  ORF type:complete len:112 (+),score=10.91 gb/GFBE01063855.1/:1-336(+)
MSLGPGAPLTGAHGQPSRLQVGADGHQRCETHLSEQLEEARVALLGCELDFRKTAGGLRRLQEEKQVLQDSLRMLSDREALAQRRLAQAKAKLVEAAETSAKATRLIHIAH